jgi:hypothetical protein
MEDRLTSSAFVSSFSEKILSPGVKPFSAIICLSSWKTWSDSLFFMMATMFAPITMLVYSSDKLILKPLFKPVNKKIMWTFPRNISGANSSGYRRLNLAPVF